MSSPAGEKIFLAIWRALRYNVPVTHAGVMESVDVADSKSAGGDTVWVRVPPPAPENPSPKGLGFSYPLRKQWYIITLQRVYHHRRCILLAEGCIRFRNDEIQNSVLMIYNSYGINDTQCFALIYFLSEIPCVKRGTLRVSLFYFRLSYLHHTAVAAVIEMPILRVKHRIQFVAGDVPV